MIYRVLNELKAEEEGFEPPVPRGTTVFKTAAFDHSATPLVGSDALIKLVNSLNLIQAFYSLIFDYISFDVNRKAKVVLILINANAGGVKFLRKMLIF